MTSAASIVTAAGDFQSELGCPGDWQPDCLKSWLEDPDGDGIYTFLTTAIPAGSYQVKAAVGLSWTVNYGAGGQLNGPNIPFTVRAAGDPVKFSFDSTSHVLSVLTGAAATVDITTPKAYWLSTRYIGWQSRQLGTKPQLSAVFRAERRPGCHRHRSHRWTAFPLTYDPAGLPAVVKEQVPGPGRPRRTAAAGWVRGLVRGSCSAGRWRWRPSTLTATWSTAPACRSPACSDDLYAGAARRTPRADLERVQPTLALWAPTAQAGHGQRLPRRRFRRDRHRPTVRPARRRGVVGDRPARWNGRLLPVRGARSTSRRPARWSTTWSPTRTAWACRSTPTQPAGQPRRPAWPRRAGRS